MPDTKEQTKPGQPPTAGGAAPHAPTPPHGGATATATPATTPTTTATVEPAVPNPKSDALLKKLGQVLAQAAASDQPAQATSEGVEGGRFIRGARLQNGKLYGGEVVDAHGNQLATFDDKQINTGNPDDGTPPEKPGA